MNEQHEIAIADAKGSAGRAYTRNQWAALNHYTEAGELSMDNNVAE